MKKLTMFFSMFSIMFGSSIAFAAVEVNEERIQFNLDPAHDYTVKNETKCQVRGTLVRDYENLSDLIIIVEPGAEDKFKTSQVTVEVADKELPLALVIFESQIGTVCRLTGNNRFVCTERGLTDASKQKDCPNFVIGTGAVKDAVKN